MTPHGTEQDPPVKPYSNALMTSLTRVIAQWSAPDFLTSVVAREGLDLDPGAITVITFLSNGGPLRPSKLAQKMVTGASNVSKILARLTAAGIVKRIPDPADARASLVTLTLAGRKVAASFIEAGDSLVEDLLTGWDEQDRHDLVRLLGKLDQSTATLSSHLRNNQDHLDATAPESSMEQK